jgi:hypothetical protein
MPLPLDYDSRRQEKSLALPAFIVGICSGPAAFGLALLAAANDHDERTKELGGIACLAAVLGGALIFGCFATGKLPSNASPRQRRMAHIAIAAPIAWGIAIIAFILYALSQA